MCYFDMEFNNDYQNETSKYENILQLYVNKVILSQLLAGWGSTVQTHIAINANNSECTANCFKCHYIFNPL